VGLIFGLRFPRVFLYLKPSNTKASFFYQINDVTVIRKRIQLRFYRYINKDFTEKVQQKYLLWQKWWMRRVIQAYRVQLNNNQCCCDKHLCFVYLLLNLSRFTN
jgi:hypothetical protein